MTSASRPIRVLELRSVRGTGGGPEKTILRGAAGATSRGIAVTVCYIRDGRDPIFAIDRRSETQHVEYVEVAERHSFDLRAWADVRQLVRNRRFDLVHAHDYKTDLMALYLARAERVAAVATAHGWTGHSPRERFLYYPADRKLLARFPLVIAVSEEIRARLVRAGAAPSRVRTILNGIDPAAFARQPVLRPAARHTFGLEPSDIAVGSVGRLAPQKRFDLLLRAFATLRNRMPRLRLLIAGDGDDRGALERLACRLGVAASCRFVGHQSDIVRFHHALDLFVQSSEYEGTPNVVLEAMSLETPVVATDVGGTRDLIEHDVHGLIVRPRDPGALAGAIQTALDHPERTRARAAAARRRVEAEFTFAGRTARVESMYRDLVDATRR
jgi:glycosyltransferase involved in cell wall biosynthesis